MEPAIRRHILRAGLALLIAPAGFGLAASAQAHAYLRRAVLNAAHLWAHTDGEMFWHLTHGMDSPRGGLAMPGYGEVLGSEARWVLIDFLRARNASVALSERGAWNHPIPAPEPEARCGDGRVVALENFRDRVVRTVVGPPARADGLATIFIDPGQPREDACAAGAPEVRLSYAIVAGLAPATPAGIGHRH